MDFVVFGEDETFHRRLNNAMFPGVCSSYHLHHVAGKVVALAEFEAFGQAYASDIVRNAKAFASSLAAEGFEVLAESRGYTASHQVLTRHGEIDSGAGARGAKKLEDAGIITNMNMLPGIQKRCHHRSTLRRSRTLGSAWVFAK